MPTSPKPTPPEPTAAPPKPPATPTLPPLTLLQVLGLVGLLAGLLVAVDLNQRLAAADHLRASANIVATEVAALQAEHEILQTQVAYATTDTAVIEWAHQGGKMIQGGEVLVVPILPTPLPTVIPSLPTPAAPPPNWELWRDLLLHP